MEIGNQGKKLILEKKDLSKLKDYSLAIKTQPENIILTEEALKFVKSGKAGKHVEEMLKGII